MKPIELLINCAFALGGALIGVFAVTWITHTQLCIGG